MAEHKIAKDPKYFIPNEEDIRVGYEYEFHGMTAGGLVFFDEPEKNIPPSIEIWSKEICTDNVWTGRKQADILSLIKSNQIRVPFLTKEQIEAEGWKYTGRTIDVWFEKEGSFEIGSWTSYKIRLHYGLQDHRLYVHAIDFGDEHPLFEGECKSINEFKTIMKWLKLQ